MDLHNQILDPHDSIMDLHKSVAIMDIHNSYLWISTIRIMVVHD